MNAGRQTRNISMVLIGVSCLLLKHWLYAWLPEIVYSYLGNISVSFSVFFLTLIAANQRLNRIISVLVTLVIVEFFELTDGFSVLSNVSDSWDYLANAFGIFLALGVDCFFHSEAKQSKI